MIRLLFIIILFAQSFAVADTATVVVKYPDNEVKTFEFTKKQDKDSEPIKTNIKNVDCWVYFVSSTNQNEPSAAFLNCMKYKAHKNNKKDYKNSDFMNVTSLVLCNKSFSSLIIEGKEKGEPDSKRLDITFSCSK